MPVASMTTKSGESLNAKSFNQGAGLVKPNPLLKFLLCLIDWSLTLKPRGEHLSCFDKKLGLELNAVNGPHQ